MLNVEQRLDELYNRLRERGSRLTPQRVAIVRAIINHPGHPTAEQIHNEILRDFPTTSLATVYKTLHLLKEVGEVLELGFGDDGSRFDGRRPYPHPHLICTRCGKIQDTRLEGFDAIVSGLAEQADFQVRNHRFDIFGLCAECKK